MFGADGGSNRVPFHPLHRDSWELSMLHHVKTLGYKISTFLVAFSVIAALCGETLSASASPSTELKKMFRQMDRQLCRSISPDRCKHKKRSTALHPQFQNEITPTKPSAPSELASPSVAVDVRGATKQSVMPPSPSVAPPSPRVDVKAKAVAKSEKHSTVQVPIPRLRPEHLGSKEELVPTSVPTSKPLPARTGKKLEQSAIPKSPPVPVLPVPPVFDLPIVPPGPPAPHPTPDNTLFGEACFSQLQKLGVKFDRLPITVGSGACSVSDPVRLNGVQLSGNYVRFPDAPTFNCGFAIRFSNWVKEQAEPIVQSHLSTSIATIGTGPGYQCRGRNGDISAKLSEHAFGNAVDIERLKLADGQVIEVVNAIDTSSKYQPVLAALRTAGCQFFMTVIGPGTNSAHASHFHFDLERRGKKGNNRLCE